MPVYRKAVKAAASVGASLLVGGPVFYPMLKAAQGLLGGGSPEGAWNTFIWEAAGIGSNGQVNSTKLPEVVGRDIAFVGLGYMLRWAAKRV